jgi:hypothetical protein
MMDKMISIITICVALTLVIGYSGICIYQKANFHYHVMIGIVLNSSGLIIGFLLVASTLFRQIKRYLVQIDLYLFIAGLAVLAVSIQGIYRALFI